MGSGDYLTCSSNIVVNEDLSATVTLELCNVCYKSMLSVTSKPEEWIKDMTHNRARKAGDIIYKQEFDRYLDSGTLPPNATKGNLILAYEFPVVVESSSEPPPVLDDPVIKIEADLSETKTELKADLSETKSELKADLQTTKEDLQTTLTELAEAKTDLEEKTYQIISLEARLAALEQKFISN
jgi:hypothetical protein